MQKESNLQKGPWRAANRTARHSYNIMKKKYLGRLCIRSLFCIAALILYFADKSKLDFTQKPSLFLVLFWLFLAGEFILRFIPSERHHIGMQKHLARNYEPRYETVDPVQLRREVKKLNYQAIKGLTFFFALNGFFYAGYFLKVLGNAEMFLLVPLYSVVDAICALYFCPFRDIVVKNRCCTVCRIYNWDMLMNCTPILLIPCPYTIPLTVLSVIYTAIWEISFYRHPERFTERYNKRLGCDACTVDICPKGKK